MKLVCQLDADGYFVGTTTADESPLEKGVYLMPAGTVDAAAPSTPPGHRARWDNEWVFEVIPVPPEPEPIPQFPLEECKYKAKQRIAATDWAVLPDVNIQNQAEFVEYRAALRALILNPVVDPVWPSEPQPVWQ